MLFRKTQKRNMCKALIDSVSDKDLLFILLIISLQGKETNASTLIRCRDERDLLNKCSYALAIIFTNLFV